MDYVPWGRERFIPFDPSKLDVTEKEANHLYSPKRTKEDKEREHRFNYDWKLGKEKVT